MIKTYTEMCTFNSFEERLEYLQLVSDSHTSPRQVSNGFYKSSAWKKVRDMVIERDMGFDLGVFGVAIDSSILVHHMNPLVQKDLDNWDQEKLLDPEYLICVSYDTHAIIHYGKHQVKVSPTRHPGDTKLW